MKLGIVIVTHNSRDVIESCLDALPGIGTEIVVIDNASSDDTVRRVSGRENVRLIANPENAGFAGAVNQGIRELESEYILLLNPDVTLAGPLDGLVRTLEPPDAGAAAGKLVNLDGSPQRGFSVRRFPSPAALAFEALGWNRLWPGNPVNRAYRCLDMDLNEPADVEQPAGAFLLLKREAWQSVGGFDEDFFPLWFEDVDYLLRLRQQGFRIRYEPVAKAVHTGGHSIAQLSPGCRQLRWYGSLLRYASKHYSPARRRIVCASVALGSLIRMLTSTVLERSLQPIATYGTVSRIALQCFFTGRVQTPDRRIAVGMTG